MKFLIFLLFAVVASEGIADKPATPADNIGDLEKADMIALREALLEAGGPGGTLENITTSIKREPSDYTDQSNCSNWNYDNTTIYPNGRFRHEFAVLHTEENPPELRYSGFIGDRFAARPFAITYLGGYGNAILSKAEDKCELLPEGVLACNLCVRTHFVFHDRPEIGCQDVPQEILEPTTLANGEILEEVIGLPEKAITPLRGSVELANLTILPLLEHFGGAPGKVTTNRRKPAKNEGNTDASPDQWLYDFRFTNGASAIRFEHAVLRSAGSPEQHEDIFGSIYWRSRSGDLYIKYRQNSTGLHAESQWATIRVYRSFWTVNYPPGRLCKLVHRPGLVAQLLSQPH